MSGDESETQALCSIPPPPSLTLLEWTEKKLRNSAELAPLVQLQRYFWFT